MRTRKMCEAAARWFPCLALAAFAAAVFMIAGGHFWCGIALVGAGASLISAAAVMKKEAGGADGECTSGDGNSKIGNGGTL